MRAMLSSRTNNPDFMSYLKLWDFYKELKGRLSQNQLRKACRENFLSHTPPMREWLDVHRQLLRITTQAGFAHPPRAEP